MPTTPVRAPVRAPDPGAPRKAGDFEETGNLRRAGAEGVIVQLDFGVDDDQGNRNRGDPPIEEVEGGVVNLGSPGKVNNDDDNNKNNSSYPKEE